MAFKLPNATGRAASWKLDIPSSELSEESNYLPRDKFPKEPSSIIDGIAPALDSTVFKDVGITQYIVKIESRFENEKTGHSIWKIGTGWLIRPDVVITAGDVVYDAEYNLGAATRIKCYIGYPGRISTEEPKIQPRYGQKVVTSAEWIDGPERRSRDIAFIHVAPQFAIDIPTETVKEPEKTVEEPETEPNPEPVVDLPEVEIPVDTGDKGSPPTIPSVITEEEYHVVPEPNADEFFEVLKTVAKVDKNEHDIESPLLGGVGNHVSIAAGALLASITGIQGDFEEELPVEKSGCADRALLAEAVLLAVLSTHESPELEKVVFDMKQNWEANAPAIDAIVDLLCPELTECALQINANRSAHGHAHGAGKGRSFLKRRALAVRQLDDATTGDAVDFVRGLFGHTLPIRGLEDIFSSIGPVLKKALSASQILVSPASKAAVAENAPKLRENLKGANAEVPAISALSPNELASRILIQRAIMADVALQALMNLDRGSLERLRAHPEDIGESENIFDFLKTTVQKLGPLALLPAKQAVEKFIYLVFPAQKVEVLAPIAVEERPATTGGARLSLRDVLGGRKTSMKVG